MLGSKVDHQVKSEKILYLHSRGHIFYPILMKRGQNVSLQY